MEQEIIEMENIVKNELTVQHDTITLRSETFAARNFRGFAFFGLFHES